MTSPKLIWNTPRWSSGNLVQQFPDLRMRYSDAVHAAVEWARDRVDDDRDQPLAKDCKHTLRRVAKLGLKADLNGLGRDATCALDLQAYRRFRVGGRELLTDAQSRGCAQDAAGTFEKAAGPASTDAHAVRLVRAILVAWDGGLREAELKRLQDQAANQPSRKHGHKAKVEEQLQLAKARKDLLKSCLAAAGLKSGHKNVERLITAARQGPADPPLEWITIDL